MWVVCPKEGDMEVVQGDLVCMRIPTRIDKREDHV